MQSQASAHHGAGETSSTFHQRSHYDDLNIYDGDKLVFSRASPLRYDVTIILALTTSLVFGGLDFMETTSLGDAVFMMPHCLLLLVYACTFPYLLLGVCGHRLEIDRANGTIVFDDMRATKVMQSVKRLEDLQYIKLFPKGRFWTRAPELHFEDEVWHLCGGPPQKSGFTNQLDPSTIQQIASFGSVPLVHS